MVRAAVLVLLAGGCHADPQFECEPMLELSDGLDSDFVALEAGGTVVVEHGPQGGNHVWFGGRVTGPGPGLLLHGRMFDNRTGEGIGGLSADSTGYANMADFDGCEGTFSGGRSILEGLSDDEVCALDGASLRLEVDVQHFEGSYSYSAGGRSNPAGIPNADATASIEVVGALSDTVRVCICGEGTTGDTFCSYY